MAKHDKELLDTIFLQPWFLRRETAFAIRRILPPEHRHQMKFYFDDYGCMKCGEKDVPYVKRTVQAVHAAGEAETLSCRKEALDGSQPRQPPTKI